jgi:hypothetical protein
MRVGLLKLASVWRELAERADGRTNPVENRRQELRRRISLYRGFLEDAVRLDRIEFYLTQICDSEDELARIDMGRRLH